MSPEELREASVQGVRLPAFLYGTAWKEGATGGLVRLALEQGFRGIDTANQRRHYHEAAVGEALAEAFAAGLVGRDQLFLQTKFTHRPGQDHRLPYDPRADVATQVVQSFESSLAHLGVERLDSYLLHGPSRHDRLDTVEDVPAWRAMESLKREGRTLLIGISNVTLRQLEELCELGGEAPACVQNRCHASTGWDLAVRRFCRAHGILYQGFSLLTANVREMAHPDLLALARRKGCRPAQLVFRFAREAGMICLTGTSRAEHMRQDLDALDIDLDPEETRLIESIGLPGA